jgi:hypothetical protein
MKRLGYSVTTTSEDCLLDGCLFTGVWQCVWHGGTKRSVLYEYGFSTIRRLLLSFATKVIHSRKKVTVLSYSHLLTYHACVPYQHSPGYSKVST